MTSDALCLGSRITCLPVIHGSGDFAVAVRRLMLEEPFDCLAVPLPPSFQADGERGIEMLPSPTIVTQPETSRFRTERSPESGEADDGSELERDGREEPTYSYVPIDPC